MNLTYTRPGELRKPDVEVLPDGRIRVTRYIAAGHGDRDLSEVTEAVGSTDSGLSTALLVKKGMARVEGKDAIVKTYEVRNASTETRIGNDDIQFGENGLKTIVADFVQMSSGTYVPGVVGTSVSSLDATCVLRSEVVEDDGTSRLIRRTYINKGLLSVTDETRNNGALFIKTLVYLNDVPSPNPPTGYVLISQRTENPLGLETTTLTFAKGEGQVSQDDDTKNNGALLLRTIRYISAPGTLGTAGTNPIATPSGYILITQNYQESEGHRIWNASYAKGVGEISRDIDYSQTSDQGVTGITRTSIRYLVAPSGAVQPSVLAGSVKIGESVTESDGHRVWTTVWAKGTGFVVNAREYRNNQKLLITRQTYIGSSGPSTPSPVIGGVVVQISYNYREESGYRVWDLVWAEGIGEISRDIDYSQSSNEGTTGLTRTTIRYLVDPSGTVLPATLSGSVKIGQSVSEAEGYRIWTTVWAKGTGLISKQSPRELGQGLRMETWVSLGANYDPSFMLPAGILRFRDNDEIDGTKRWTVSCIQNAAGASPLTGTTVASYEVVSAGDYYFSSGATVTVSGGGGASATGTAVLSGGSTGYLTAITLGSGGSGYTSPPLVTITGFGSGSTLPTAVAVLSGLALSRERLVKFRYPGRARAVSLQHPNISGSANLEIQLSPFIETELIGTEEISYRADNSLSDLANPLWAPTEWATIFAQYVSPNGYPVSRCEGLRDYRTVGGVSAIEQSYGAVSLVTVLGNETGYISGKKAYLKVFGGPDAPDGKVFTLEADCDLAFIAYDGTKYYRRTVVFAAIPQQAAMPELMTTVTMISTTVTSIATLKAVTTVGAVVGGRTNAFTYTFTQGGTLFTRQMMGTLTSGSLSADTLFLIKPNDYNGSTPLYWTLS